MCPPIRAQYLDVCGPMRGLQCDQECLEDGEVTVATGVVEGGALVGVQEVQGAGGSGLVVVGLEVVLQLS